MAGSWKSITPPKLSGNKDMSPDTMLLLTDGSVLVHHANGKQWLRLTPDDKGDYSNGSWSSELDMAFSRQFFASAVLRDGRVCAIGGEYSSDTSLRADGKFAASGEIFDPETNLWSNMNKPSSFNWIQGDACGCMLADGRFLLGSVNDSRTAIWDPAIDYWVEAGTAFGTQARTKAGTTDEETWTLLQDGTVLTVEITNSKLAEKYLPESDTWIPEQDTPDQMVLMSVSGTTVDEIGPAVTRPDGTVFAVGGTGANAVYTPPAATTSKGSWSSGPNFPNDSNGKRLTALDAPAVLLPNGTVLCVGGSLTKETDSSGNVSYWSKPTTMFVFDPSAATPLSQHPVQPPHHGAETWKARFLLLPTGQVLMTTQGSTVDIYTPDAAELSADPSWKPGITGYPPVLIPGHSYPLTGTQFNGLSHANSYGDDAQMATNYPIVRLTRADGKTHYLRTSEHSSMGIATGAQTVSTQIDVPFGVEPGLWDLRVIANGIPSDPVSVNVATQDCILQVNKTTYSQGEVQSQGVPATFDEPALYVLVEGFKPSELGIHAGNLGNPPVKPVVQAVGLATGMQIEFAGPVIPQDTSLPDRQQRFTYPFKVVITTQSIFNFGPDTEPVPVLATVTSLDANTVTAAGLIELTRNPNPFILDGDATQGLDWYLSVDMRVFQVKAGGMSFAKSMPTSGDPNTIAPAFIQSVIGGLNDGSIPASHFDGIDQHEGAEALRIGHTDDNGTAVYNFALARVHYQDTQVAHNLRLFFRMWPAQQTNATYDQSTLYRSGVNGDGQRIPLLGIAGDEIRTIPFFAEKRVNPSADMNTQKDPSNVRSTVPASSGGSEEHIYFGCWLDINQPHDKRFPPIMIGQPWNGPFTNIGQLVSIQQLVRSAHQCLIAEISFDPDPIPSTADPSTTDKLAQRNLTFVGVPNPGLIEDARRAPQTFELRPTPSFLPDGARPDELMITWGSTPADGSADIFLPAVEASTIFDLAENLYTVHQLTVVDEHTVRVPTQPGGAAFVPVPKGATGGDGNFAGLITVNLPGTVHKGDEHDVSVRQITTMSLGQRGIGTRDGVTHERFTSVLEAITPELKHRRTRAKAEGGPAVAKEASAAAANRSFVWRRTIGVFDVAIPVGTKDALLHREERLLSILRWIGKSIHAESRWYKLWPRYLDQIAGRVNGFGGDATLIPANPDGRRPGEPFGGEGDGRAGERGERVRHTTGKVVAIAFDHFGDFVGFTIETEEGEHREFWSRERRVLALVRRAWQARLLIRVVSSEDFEREPRSIVFLDPPPFEWWRGRQ